MVPSVWSPRGPELVGDRAVVIPFENRTEDDELDGFAHTLTASTAVCLDRYGIVDVMPPERGRYISLHVAPLHIGPLVEKHLLMPKETVILTSATLRTAALAASS